MTEHKDSLLKIHLPVRDLPALEDGQTGLRRPYEPPQLIAWGSLTDLTRGAINGLQDLPLDGGTEVE